MAALVDTSVLVYRYDGRFPAKQRIATALLRQGIANDAIRLAWLDAHLWAYAEHFGLDELISEDFQHDRLYGSVWARNPFIESAGAGASGG